MNNKFNSIEFDDMQYVKSPKPKMNCSTLSHLLNLKIVMYTVLQHTLSSCSWLILDVKDPVAYIKRDNNFLQGIIVLIVLRILREIEYC